MKRGVINFTQSEAKEILERLGVSMGSFLKEKIILVSQNENGGNLELSQEDLELIMDEFIIPIEKDTQISIDIRQKVQKMISDFAQQ